VPLANGFSARCFFTIICTKSRLSQCQWMVLFELQHTLCLFHISKIRSFVLWLQHAT
jgi:hypothetical protein